MTSKLKQGNSLVHTRPAITPEPSPPLVPVALDIQVYSCSGQMQILSIYMDMDTLVIDVEQRRGEDDE